MKQQFAVSQQYTILHVMFLQKYKEKQYFVEHNILQECGFLTHLSGDVGIAVV
jgi:hypothetical protein